MDGAGRPALKLQAAGALLAVLLSWVSAPLALTRVLLDVCSMPCCISEGHCCCSPRHAHVVGETQDGRDSIGRSEVSRSCSQGCTTSSSSTLHLRNLVRGATHALVLADCRVSELQRPHLSGNLIASGSFSPRAPPPPAID